MAIEDITSLRRRWGAVIKYRHIPRGSNQLADWLTNVARVREQDEDYIEELLPDVLAGLRFLPHKLGH